MKLFTDCEIVRHHLRGNTAVVIVGDRAVTDEEGAALLAEFADSFGTTHRPVYFSKDGWQGLPEAPKAAKKSKPAASASGDLVTINVEAGVDRATLTTALAAVRASTAAGSA